MDRLDKHSQIRALRLFAAGAIVIACREPASEPRSETAPTETAPSCDTPDVRQVVERFGERLKQVPLLAPDSIVVREIREVYGSLVTPSLLDTWIAEPAGAPGRQVSSPWPERIEVDSMGPAGAGICRVVGEVVYVTSQEAMEGGAAFRERVVLRLSRDGGWRISAYEVVAPPMPDSTSASEEAVDVRGVRSRLRGDNPRGSRDREARSGRAGGRFTLRGGTRASAGGDGERRGTGVRGDVYAAALRGRRGVGRTTSVAHLLGGDCFRPLIFGRNYPASAEAASGR